MTGMINSPAYKNVQALPLKKFLSDTNHDYAADNVLKNLNH